MESSELKTLFDKLPTILRDSAYQATKEVMDMRSLAFGADLTRSMPIGNRHYNFVNVHTKTMVATKTMVEQKDGNLLLKYGWKLLYNGMGYKNVPWNTHQSNRHAMGNGHQVPFDLIANVTSTGRKNRKYIWDTNDPENSLIGSKGGNYKGNSFIPASIHNTLNGIDEQISIRFDAIVAFTEGEI